MITCTEKCRYQKNGECTYEAVTSTNIVTTSLSNCVYFKQE